MFRKVLSLLGIPTGEEIAARQRARRDAEAAQRAEHKRKDSQRQIEGLGYPLRYVSGSEAQAALMAERQIGRAEGFTPVIVRLDVFFLEKPTKHKIGAVLHEARGIDGARWLKTRLDADLSEWSEVEEGEPDVEVASATRRHLQDLEPEGWLGAHATRQEPQEIFPPLGLLTDRVQIDGTWTDRFVDKVAIVRFPTPSSHEAIAHLLWGGWNGVPQTAELVAVLRHWQESFGAELAMVGSDVLEFTVARPPADRKAALRLFLEHYAFCSEFSEQLDDPASVDQLTTELLSGANWGFWWD